MKQSFLLLSLSRILLSYLTCRTVCAFVVQRPSRTASHLYDNNFERFRELFQGDFDNYNQVVEDRDKGMQPREGGGHEHIHCTLIPISVEEELLVMAAFYFDAMPQAIFRFRLYKIYNPMDESTFRMKLFTLNPLFEELIRRDYCTDPMEWPRVYQDFCKTDSSPYKELKRCDIEWSGKPTAGQHTYLLENEDIDDGAFHAIMIHGEAVVESQMAPGSMIRVVDQLSLWENKFWIHDRGFDPDTGDFVYGNQKGVPYHLQRVTTIQSGQREVINSKLRWTLGPSWRTEEDYEQKMGTIGGVSTRLNS